MNLRRILAGLTAVATLASVVLYWRAEGEAPTAPRLTLAHVSRGDLVRSVTAVGQLGPLVSVEVSSQISGLVTEVSVEFNTTVKAGQVLARIDSSTYQQ